MPLVRVGGRRAGGAVGEGPASLGTSSGRVHPGSGVSCLACFLSITATGCWRVESLSAAHLPLEGNLSALLSLAWPWRVTEFLEGLVLTRVGSPPCEGQDSLEQGVKFHCCFMQRCWWWTFGGICRQIPRIQSDPVPSTVAFHKLIYSYQSLGMGHLNSQTFRVPGTWELCSSFPVSSLVACFWNRKRVGERGGSGVHSQGSRRLPLLLPVF